MTNPSPAEAYAELRGYVEYGERFPDLRFTEMLSREGWQSLRALLSEVDGLRTQNHAMRVVLEGYMPKEGKQRVTLRRLLGLPDEPCSVWEHGSEGYMYCSTHAEMWHVRKPKPAVACFANQEFEHVAAALRAPAADPSTQEE